VFSWASRFSGVAPICAEWLIGVTQSRVAAFFIHSKASATLAVICPVMFQASMGVFRWVISRVAAMVEAATGLAVIGRVRTGSNTHTFLPMSKVERKPANKSRLRPRAAYREA
jgi:hypothetical protein